MTGWKTWAGAIVIGIGAARDAAGLGQWSQVAMMAGGALGLVGIGHKIEKSAK